jgi:hypothetical protein
MNQRTFLKETYYGCMDRGYGATLSAIAMRETDFNENRINLNDGAGTKYPGSYSGYQIHFNSYVQVNKLNRNEAARELQKIMDNPEYARKIATITIHENEIRRNHHEVFQQGLEMRPVPHAEVPPLRGGGGGQGQEDLSSEHRPAGYRDAQGVLRCGEAL